MVCRDLVRYRLRHEQLVSLDALAPLPTKFGTFQVAAFRSRIDGKEHLAFIKGDVRGAGDVLVRVHRRARRGWRACVARLPD